LACGSLAAVVVALLTIVSGTLGSAAKPVPVAAKATTSSRCCWTVRAGQTLYSIAAREGVFPTAVERANPRLAPTRLVAGQRVRIPT
jgi:LysM repeat protein